MIDENLKKQLVSIQAQQASKWLDVMRTPTVRQRAEFLAWLKASPHNVREMLVILELDAQFDTVDRDRHHDLSKLIQEVRHVNVVALRSRLGSDRPPLERTWSKWWVAAAGLAALALFWMITPLMTNNWKEYSTGVGEQRAFELADGSIVNLNTHSRIAVDFSSGAREVKLLQGEALFRVQHNASRPFRVRTTDAVVQAIGTQFNVYARGDATLVSVVEGKVAVAPIAELTGFVSEDNNNRSDSKTNLLTSRSLTENQEAQIDRNGEVKIHAVPDATEAIAWRERRLVFRDERLEQIIQEFNRYNREQIRLDENIDISRQYSGVFNVDDPQTFLQVLAKDQRLEIRTTESEYVITGR